MVRTVRHHVSLWEDGQGELKSSSDEKLFGRFSGFPEHLRFAWASRHCLRTVKKRALLGVGPTLPQFDGMLNVFGRLPRPPRQLRNWGKIAARAEHLKTDRAA